MQLIKEKKVPANTAQTIRSISVISVSTFQPSNFCTGFTSQWENDENQLGFLPGAGILSSTSRP
eukprot:COSAG02_NODE_27038_length_618_cov_1.084778_2_plen_63_part_01